jgi:uncharacterized membrane protein YqgA involved in biofilm formation
VEYDARDMDLFARTSGTWLNMAMVLLGTAVGLLAGGRLPHRIGRTLMQVLGLVCSLIGLRMAWALDALHAGPLPGVLVALVSLAVGGVAGELLGIEERLTGLGELLRRRFRGSGRFTDGFVTASLLFCVGPMAVVGSIQNGLQLDVRTLVLKSTLDGVSSMALAGVYGAGVGVSALLIGVVQGGMSLGAAGLARALPNPATDVRVLLVSGVGGLLIVGIGVNLLLAGLGLEDRRVRVAALLPALAIAPILSALLG